MGALESVSRENTLPERRLSEVFELCRLQQVSEVIFRDRGVLEVITNAGFRFAARLIDSMPTAMLFDTLLKNGVSFRDGRTVRISWDRAGQLFIVLVTLYCYSRITKQFLGQMGDEEHNKVVLDSDRRKHRRRPQKALTWDSVAGADEARRELMEVIDFMRSPQKFYRMGARCPKGILLAGPPGCGKTLLARAAASEAGVDFIACSASDFVELYVGRGAARIRELFKAAENRAPCILFFDEIDALAKSRTGGINGNDEREQTLNQLLTQMDGFDALDAFDEADDENEERIGGQNGALGGPNQPVASWAGEPSNTKNAKSTKAIVVIAATNRPEILDRALLRPGRFDRLVKVELPTQQGRLDILKVHVNKRSVPIENISILERIARETDGFSGAELQNIVNEAALLAVRHGHLSVSDQIVLEALAKVREAHLVTENQFSKDHNSTGIDNGEISETLQGLVQLSKLFQGISADQRRNRERPNSENHDDQEEQSKSDSGPNVEILD